MCIVKDSSILTKQCELHHGRHHSDLKTNSLRLKFKNDESFKCFEYLIYKNGDILKDFYAM